MILEIEGIDGAGKTTQCELLREWFKKRGVAALCVKDLESTEFGKEVRKMLELEALNSKEVELFAFLACKSQLFSQVILPSITKKTIVICDRGAGSFLSYFEVFGFSHEFLSNSINLATGHIKATLTILLDVSVEEARKRKLEKNMMSRFDRLNEDFFKKQSETFSNLANRFSWRRIDGCKSIITIHEQIVEEVCAIKGLL